MRGLLTLLLVAWVFGPATAAEQDPPGLRVLKAKIRFGKARVGKPPADSVKLTARFRDDWLPAEFDPDSDRVAVSVGPVTVISLPTASDRAEWARIDPFRNRFREKRNRDHPDATRFRLDTRRGEITLRAKRIDLSALRAAGSEDVTVTLRLGETEFVATIDFGDRDGRWTHRAATHGNGFVPFDPGDVPRPLTFRILNHGYHTGASTLRTHVFRTTIEYHVFWSAKYPGPPPGIGMPVTPPPIVDFETEMVVVVELGLRTTGGYRVDIGGVVDTGSGLRVNWIERTPSGCMVTQDDTRPFVMAAVTRRDGAVSFNGSVAGGGTCP